MSELGIFLLSLAAGAPCGAYLVWERFIRHDRPPVNFLITQEVLYQINGAMVTQWLDEHGMVWMPKGPEFKAKVKP